MDDHRVRRGLEFGHDYPCPAEAAVNTCAANCLPKFPWDYSRAAGAQSASPGASDGNAHS